MKFFMVAGIAAIILSGLMMEGSPQSLGNLTVNLGFCQFPAKYTCGGLNVSPQVEISGLNNTSKVASLAMVLDDLDAPKGIFIHWLIWNLPPVNVIPSNIPKVMKVTEPIRAVQGSNGAGMIGYFGPCPPPGRPHRYILNVYGLDGLLNLSPGSNESDLASALKGHIVVQGEAKATFGG
jgi:Raf kinase inhibitor-like YbhB/YbcL family protein